jgi:hypothetical protein
MEHVYTLDTTGKIKNTKMDRVEKSNCDTTWGSQILAQEVVNCKLLFFRPNCNNEHVYTNCDTTWACSRLY